MIIAKELKIITKEIVMSPCIIYPIRSTSGFSKVQCEKCDYFKEPNICHYDTVNQEIIHESQISDAYYYKKMQCSKCAHIIDIVSPYKKLRPGENYQCTKCNALHTYIENDSGNHIFAVSVTDEDEP